MTGRHPRRRVVRFETNRVEPTIFNLGIYIGKRSNDLGEKEAL